MSGEENAQESATINVPAGGDAGESNSLKYTFLRRHMQFDPLMIVFTILILVGGLIGYFTKGSTASLTAGIIFFILLAVSTYIEGTRKIPWPLILTLLALGIMMFYRYTVSGNFMPSGLVALFTLLMLVRHGYLIYLRRQSEAV